jgi:predicted O-methyltransferase YrrM
MQEFSDIVTYHITVSDDAVKRFPDESLDFVYIDPNHSYKHAYHDTFAWWEIVTPNGILAGHDMFNPQYPGVTQAVLELCEAYKLTAYIIPEEVNKDGKKIVDPSWYILKGEGSETHFCQEGGEL